jgi:2-oxoglutarate ferredoxin oxidoreductase subunit beta
MVYIVENNGVYGLTKGQFSATADVGTRSKQGSTNNDQPIDLACMALLLGATYVGRSFSGDKKQLVPLIKGALRHHGAAVIDVISPCIAFNNHSGSTKSFDYVREHNNAVNFLDVMVGRKEITTDYAPGSVQQVTQHNGSVLQFRKLHDEYDPSDRVAALTYLQQRQVAGEVVTGLLYIDPDARDLHAACETVDQPLNTLDQPALCPGSKALDAFNAAHR